MAARCLVVEGCFLKMMPETEDGEPQASWQKDLDLHDFQCD